MKKWMVLGLVAALSLGGCGSKDEMPEACNELADMVKDMVKEMPDSKEMLGDFEKEMEKARDEWKNLSAEERKKAEQECIDGKAEFEQMNGMLKMMIEMQKAQPAN